jgi:hypothetical protein
MLLLGIMGFVLACNLGVVVYMLARTRKLDKPLTAREALRAAPPFKVDAIRQARLTARGKVLVIMTAAFGLVAIVVSMALIARIASTGLNPELVPAVVMILLVDLVPVGFGMVLYRTREFLLNGQIATGIVVEAKVGGIKSWDLFYDFLDGSGHVIRGSSLRSFYTVALARAFHGATLGDYFAVGSYVPVLYRAEKPERNALYVSFAWSIGRDQVELI